MDITTRIQLFDDVEICLVRFDFRWLRAEYWHQCNNGFDSLLNRAGDDNLTAGITDSPQGGSFRVNSVQPISEVQRITVAPALNPGIDFLAWFAFAAAEVPVVVEQDGQTSLTKFLRVFSVVMVIEAVVP